MDELIEKINSLSEEEKLQVLEYIISIENRQ